MEIFTGKNELAGHLQALKRGGKSVGFVPTMGALHPGHLSLIRAAQQQTDYVVCSIFVNPTQFNDPSDLDGYPRPIDADTRLLHEAGCNLLFRPQVEEMYPGGEKWELDIGKLETILEGEFRPGHYQGVTQIVYKLFRAVHPDMAFFGQKDYQQFLIIEQMVRMLQLPVRLSMCPILREADGLAMSSRNVHLSREEHLQALILFRTLDWVRLQFDPQRIAELEYAAGRTISEAPGLRLEYFRIADGTSLEQATPASPRIIALVAARVGNTRLIDNMILRWPEIGSDADNK